MADTTTLERVLDLPEGFWLKPFASPAHSELAIALDVREDERGYTVTADIPGVRTEDIEVAVDGHEVTLRAETISSMMSRSFSLRSEVDSAALQAEYRDGVLSLLLPKKP